jgi:hypothetical protein
MKKTRTGYAVLSATVAEMSPDPAAGSIDIPVDTGKIKGILERDKDPRFVTIQVAREGVSKNGRNYSADVIQSIAEQINSTQPIGGAGHIPDDQRSHAFPKTETVWLGAVVKEIDGKKVCYAKGYVFPDAQNRRNYLQVAKDLGKNVAVSIYGKAEEAQVGHPPVEIDPVEALQIQTHVPIEDVVHGHHAGRHRVPPGERRQRNPASLASPNRNVTCQPDHHLGGPRRSLIRSWWSSVICSAVDSATRASLSRSHSSSRR